jgi:hypothetical protein
LSKASQLKNLFSDRLFTKEFPMNLRTWYFLANKSCQSFLTTKRQVTSSAGPPDFMSLSEFIWVYLSLFSITMEMRSNFLKQNRHETKSSHYSASLMLNNNEGAACWHKVNGENFRERKREWAGVRNIGQ